ncbi:ricin-type beta-trefoil lectin domain protein [Mucilaginibacter gynuensis]|uniref:galactosylceramidase n=2 Tax=Mucilaginibacter gynuensis TaxID=1302236 RepID=A0ABP8HMH5_9SPHI
MLVIVSSIQAQTTIVLNANNKGRVFEGIGAVSAGASTRNLVDYPEKQRSEVLDFLFRPKFGAGFQHLKVEIGSGENSTCGSEPSHVVTREELLDPKPRGYEFWLMAEARKRNPKVILDCLPWAYPYWIGNRFSQESADWMVSFLDVAKKQYGLDIDWVSAAQNENGTDLNWIANHLRPTLNAHGFSKVKLQAPDDDSKFWQVFDEFEKHRAFDSLISAVGYHYIDGREPWDIDQKNNHPATEKAKESGKPLWASEEWSQSGQEWEGKGALYLARLMNKLYTRDRITKFEIWCPVDGIYDQIIWPNTGAIQADSPWSGHYTVWPSVWALAHTTQFAEPGWVYMDAACGQLNADTWRGSHVAMRNPKTGDWSVIIVTGEKRRVKLAIGNGLKNGPVYLWKSTEKEQFIRQKPLRLNKGTIEITLEADAIYTLTSTTGQTKGSFGTPPESKPFSFPYKEDFSSYKPGQTPLYFSDQKGTFETYQYPNGGMCLAQIVPDQGILWYNNWLLKPHTLFGDANWQNYSIDGDVLLEGGDVEIGGRYADRNKLGLRWILTRDGRWQLNWQYTTLASGQIEDFQPSNWHHLRMEMNGDQVAGFVDGHKLAAVTIKAGSKGMAFIASTYNRNLFDNIHVAPIAAE